MQRPIEHLLTEIPFFDGLDEASLAFVAGCAGNVHFEAGALLFREGDEANSFFVVRHGTVAVETFVPGRGSVTIETVGPGEVLGWSWLFQPYRWHFDARALTPVRATAFDGTCLRTKSAEDPRLGYELMGRFADVLIERLQWTRLRLLDVYGNGRAS